MVHPSTCITPLSDAYWSIPQHSSPTPLQINNGPSLNTHHPPLFRYIMVHPSTPITHPFQMYNGLPLQIYPYPSFNVLWSIHPHPSPTPPPIYNDAYLHNNRPPLIRNVIFILSEISRRGSKGSLQHISCPIPSIPIVNTH